MIWSWWPRSSPALEIPSGALSGSSLAAASRTERSSTAAASPSCTAAKSLGPPRPMVSRVKARSISGQRLRIPRSVSAIRSASTKYWTMSRRPLMALGSVSGAARCEPRSRAPAPVIVLSMTPKRDPFKVPDRLRVSSRFRRVAASISITWPAAICFGWTKRGSRPFCVIST